MRKPILTEKQERLIVLKRLGYSAHEIADALKISPHTVRDHWKAIFRRLSVRTQLEALIAHGRNAPTQKGGFADGAPMPQSKRMIAEIVLTPPEVALELAQPLPRVYRAFRAGVLPTELLAEGRPLIFPTTLAKARASFRRWLRKEAS